eukprot:TRINITY_DN3890_c1_g1_i1.p1 TRINITY_DN3890_c1_g1~~TRINITY_DN3890_c1_g1_i1.p1  ORF type:complete len:156 (+),score=61.35 TRINITY_DN3890_c1_g1_i1:49-468(+)
MVCSFIHRLVKETIPAYLQALPLSKNTEELAKMNPDEMIFLGTVFVASIIFLVGMWSMLPGSGGAKNTGKVNHRVKLNEPKGVDTIPVPEQMAKANKEGKLVMCRCWKSKNFPYCDGSHNDHNKATGDNVGPLILPIAK